MTGRGSRRFPAPGCGRAEPTGTAIEFRTEHLKKTQVGCTVRREYLDEPRAVDEIPRMLRASLLQLIADTHREAVGDITFEHHEDLLHGEVRFRMWVRTRRSQESVWWEVWEAWDADLQWFEEQR